MGKNVSLGARVLAVIGAGFWCVVASAASDWTLARSAHAEVYAQSGEGSARSMALLIERLHTFFSQTAGLSLDRRPPVRVVVFRSADEYGPYRLRPSANAYYMGSEARDYIVMPSLGPGDAHVAAHEYWHVLAGDSGLRLPLWLEEGMAEFFANIRLSERDQDGAAELVGRFRAMHGQPWMPLGDLLALSKESPLRDDRQTASRFYAQSWALTEMLLVSPAYSPRFPQLLAALVSGTASSGALVLVYEKPLATINTDLKAWVEKRRVAPVMLPDAPDTGVEVGEVSPLAARAVLADLLATAGQLERAEALYRDLAKEAPDDPNLLAALGNIALRKNDNDSARQLLRHATQQGLQDDNVFFNLALLENNAGEYEAALADLRAMRNIAPAREFGYWAARAYAANQLGQRQEAEDAAEHARNYASTEDERQHAAELRMIAQTDVVVQLTRDASGHVRLLNRRAPHGLPDWNPFIEPGDQVRRAEGKLRAIDCGAETVFFVETAAGLLRLAVPDPLHVQMRNAPAEYTCGAQPANSVAVVYAESGSAGGVLRGIEFR